MRRREDESLVSTSEIQLWHNRFDFFEMAIACNELKAKSDGDCRDDEIDGRNGSTSFQQLRGPNE